MGSKWVDISLSCNNILPMDRFLCDGMMGKLARYLRIAGFDVEYIKTANINELIIKARQEQRTILTRNTKIKDWPEVFYINSEIPEEQLKIVWLKYRLGDKAKFFSRCIICNKELIKVKKDEIKGKIPYYTFKNFDTFTQCPMCHRIYWPGSHLENMKKRIEEISPPRGS